MLAKDIMTRDVAFVTADTHICDVARLLIERGISGVPVVDADHRPVGMISEGDLIRTDEFRRDARCQWWLAQLAEGQPLDPGFLATIRTNGHTVQKIMTAPAISVPDTAEVSEVAQLIETHKIKRVLVVRAGRMIGLVSRADIVRAVAAEHEAAALPTWSMPQGRVVANGPTDTPLSESRIFQRRGHSPNVEIDIAPPLPAWLIKRPGLVKDETADTPRSELKISTQKAHPPTTETGLTAHDFRALVQKHELEEDQRRAESRRVALEIRNRRIKEQAERSLSDRDWREMLENARKSAANGLTDFMLMRFPSQLCSDGGRAINAPDPHWPSTLRGEPADIFTRWRDELKPHGFQLAAQIIDFPDGMPGDAALFLIWGA